MKKKIKKQEVCKACGLKPAKKLKAFIDNREIKKKQGVPEGADPAVHERCIHHLKDQGHSKESAFAICNATGAGQK